MRESFRNTLTAILVVILLPLSGFIAGQRVEDLKAPQGFDRIAAAGRTILEKGARPVTAEELIDAAIRGMLAATGDPYAALLTEDELDALGGLVDGEEIIGIGVSLEPDTRSEGLRVVAVIPDTPAERGGVRSGDLIVAIDGAAVRPAAEDPTRPLKGGAGEPVELKIIRGEATLTIELVRERIRLPDVFPRRLPSGLGYVRVIEFGNGVAEAMRVAIQDLLGEGATGIVLDLRDNPGGVAFEAFASARVFIDEGVIGTIEERDRDPLVLRGDGTAIRDDFPIAVLVNGRTASASEILAAALQDSGRATIVGTRTFGKGSVLTVTPVDEGGPTIQFTTAFFLRPDGRELEGLGVTPDVPVSQTGPGDPQLRRATRLLLAEA